MNQEIRLYHLLSSYGSDYTLQTFSTYKERHLNLCFQIKQDLEDSNIDPEEVEGILEELAGYKTESTAVLLDWFDDLQESYAYLTTHVALDATLDGAGVDF